MASPRTRKRKQQRLAAIARRTNNCRWAALTRGQKSIENPERLRNEDMREALRRAYEPHLHGMLAHNDAVMQRLFAEERVWVGGKPYTYALSTNKKPPNAGG